MRLSVAVLICCMVVFCKCAFANTVKIVAVGDSNTDYVDSTHGDWPTMVTNGLSSAHPATTYTGINKGVGATASDYGLYFISGSVVANNPQIVCVMYGTNDVYYNTSGAGSNSVIAAYKGNAAFTEGPSVGGTDYSVSGFTARMQTYIDTVKNMNNGSAQASGKVLLVLMTPPPCVQPGDAGYGVGAVRDRTQLIAIANATRSLAASNNLPLVDVYNILSANPNWLPDYMVDGIHLNAAAKQILATGVVNAITPYLAADGSLNSTVLSTAPTAAISRATMRATFR